MVGFDVDDGAFVGWVGDGFSVFFVARGHGGFSLPVFFFRGFTVQVYDSCVGVVVVVADIEVDQFRDGLCEGVG